MTNYVIVYWELTPFLPPQRMRDGPIKERKRSIKGERC
nr:MAG TPA: hypothetical protein [Caudoviricetes sp.]